MIIYWSINWLFFRYWLMHKRFNDILVKIKNESVETSLAVWLWLHLYLLSSQLHRKPMWFDSKPRFLFWIDLKVKPAVVNNSVWMSVRSVCVQMHYRLVLVRLSWRALANWSGKYFWQKHEGIHQHHLSMTSCLLLSCLLKNAVMES